ncbi:hypothetical protein [Desulfobacter vibrioformis]|uniref:hypothetical protein n=1 Tax=Desulfobacter vibrioformis TaxID=34031 RepID=UPI00055753D8|nr:hypothetical protein [Desulfobacter vibrioformis]
MSTAIASYNMIAVSRAGEDAINTQGDIDTTILADKSSIADLEPRREDNSEELRGGKEEADTIYDNGATSKMSLTFNKARPQDYALVCGFGLGAVSTAAAGTSGYLHTITPIAGDLDKSRSNPSMSCAMQYGQEVFKRLFFSMAVNSLKAEFKKDAWPTLTAELVGTGKHADNVAKETVTDAANATSLTLASQVQGSTAAERLDAVHSIVADIDGVNTQVTVNAVSDADPAVVTIEAPGTATDDVAYTVIYVPAESDGWMSFPARVLETPMRVANLAITVGGSWNGSQFVGGRTLGCEVSSLTWSLENSIAAEFCMGTDYRYAARLMREGRSQTISLNQELRNFILQQYLSDNATFGVDITLSGMDYEAGYPYLFRAIFPLVGILSAPISVDGKRLAEAGDLKVLEHDTYGSVIVQVRNQVANYVNAE